MRRIIKNLHFFKTFLFLVLLWTSLAMAFFSQRGFSFLERRALAKAPRVNEWRELLYSFPRDLDSFLQDHFGFRSFLVGLHFRLTNGPLAAMIRHDALVGKDGWLFWGNEEALVDIRGDSPPPTEEELAKWVDGLDRKREWLAEKGIGFLLVVAADKPSIYPEYLPDGIRAPRAATAMDHLSRYLEKKPVNWILDLRLILRERKEKTRQLFYYKADSHWNFLGALWGFQAIGEALARIGYPISSPIRESDLTPLPFDRAAEFLYIPISPSSGSSFELKHPILDCIKKEEAPHFEDLPRFSKIVEITTCKKGRWKAVVIKDSFFDYLRLYISSSFSRVSYLSVGDQWDHSKRLIEHEKPDIVIFETIERRLRLRDELWQMNLFQP